MLTTLFPFIPFILRDAAWEGVYSQTRRLQNRVWFPLAAWFHGQPRFDGNEMTGRSLAFLLLVLAMLTGCGDRPAVQRYPMAGEVKAVDASAHSATIAAGKIGDWMEAMTMEYPVKPDGEIQKLHVGDRIEATVVVSGTDYYVTDIKVAPK
jgi:Cu/Ag efflux protein CusF